MTIIHRRTSTGLRAYALPTHEGDAARHWRTERHRVVAASLPRLVAGDRDAWARVEALQQREKDATP